MQPNMPVALGVGEVFGTGRVALAPAVLAAFLGVFMIWGVGFSSIGAVHNAAHDVRHSTGFPCH